jgi:DNA polymerase-3 subunit chi
VLITVEDEIPNGAQILFWVGGARPADWADQSFAGLARIVLLFDGRDSAALSAAREAWKSAKASGHEVTYWKESSSGKFEKQN